MMANSEPIAVRLQKIRDICAHLRPTEILICGLQRETPARSRVKHLSDAEQEPANEAG
jgi:hypothetical protein